jgi:hypothetical protein
MQLFSYHNGIPAPLPDQLRNVSVEQLKAMGYNGPFPAPQYNAKTQKAQWTGTEWLVCNLSAEEIQIRDYNRLLSRANWHAFSAGLMSSNAYAKARVEASSSLSVNVDCTELVAFMSDAKAGRPYVEGINNCLASIEVSITLTKEDKKQLHDLILATGLGGILTVPNYTPEEEMTP